MKTKIPVQELGGQRGRGLIFGRIQYAMFAMTLATATSTTPKCPNSLVVVSRLYITYVR